MKDSFCSHCGTKFPDMTAYPKSWHSCAQVTYQNPKPVVALLQPVVKKFGNMFAMGVLVLRRGRSLGAGKLGLPGGYVEFNENAEQAAIRETKEEIGLDLFPYLETISLHQSIYSTSVLGNLILFAKNQIIENDCLQQLCLTSEASEIGLVYQIASEARKEFAFSSHADAVEKYLALAPHASGTLQSWYEKIL